MLLYIFAILYIFFYNYTLLCMLHRGLVSNNYCLQYSNGTFTIMHCFYMIHRGLVRAIIFTIVFTNNSTLKKYILLLLFLFLQQTHWSGLGNVYIRRATA